MIYLFFVIYLFEIQSLKTMFIDSVTQLSENRGCIRPPPNVSVRSLKFFIFV
ncbi:hypothetical protein HanRHA438_Chr08g0329411 [Helianthus annuus]|nr:hypothetical protein HanRHA438_Chr08g0329411 [Helianthus annuus]